MFVDELDKTVIILFIVYLIGAVASMLRVWLLTLAGHRFVAQLRKKLYNNIVIQEVAFFDTNQLDTFEYKHSIAI